MALAWQATVTLNSNPLVSASGARDGVPQLLGVDDSAPHGEELQRLLIPCGDCFALESTEIHRGTQSDYSPSSCRRYIPEAIRSSCGKARDRE